MAPIGKGFHSNFGTRSAKTYRNSLSNALLVHFRVSNPDPMPCSIEVMSCSYYDHWKTDNQSINCDTWGCDGNAPIWITLTSTNAYTEDLPLWVNSETKGRELTFRMAFSPGIGPPFGTNVNRKTFWSDAIRIKVTE
jgi:hypothetical protein